MYLSEYGKFMEEMVSERKALVDYYCIDNVISIPKSEFKNTEVLEDVTSLLNLGVFEFGDEEYQWILCGDDAEDYILKVVRYELLA